MMRRSAAWRACCLCCAIVFLGAGRAHAQADTAGYSTPAPRWVAQFSALSANALLSGVTAGIIQEVRGGSFRDGFTRGALGGVVIYAGKRVAVQRFTTAGLLGREVAAAGASMVRNASDGIGTFDRFILPAGFLRVYWNRAQPGVRVKLDVVAAGYVTYGIMEDELSFNVRESLSAGTAVFETDDKVITTRRDREHAAGVQAQGVIFRSDVAGWGEGFLKRALAHERVHVLQDDQLYITLNDRLDDWALGKLGPARAANRFIDIDLSTEFLRQLARYIPKHGDRPWELEAIYLTR